MVSICPKHLKNSEIRNVQRKSRKRIWQDERSSTVASIVHNELGPMLAIPAFDPRPVPNPWIQASSGQVRQRHKRLNHNKPSTSKPVPYPSIPWREQSATVLPFPFEELVLTSYPRPAKQERSERTLLQCRKENNAACIRLRPVHSLFCSLRFTRLYGPTSGRIM